MHLCSLYGKSFKWAVPESAVVTDFNYLQLPASQTADEVSLPKQQGALLVALSSD